MNDLRCLVGIHAWRELDGGVTFDGEPVKSGVSVCSRPGCTADRVNTLVLSFFKLELSARVVGSDEPYVRMTPEFTAWLGEAKSKSRSADG
jgi:hypothetical protein